MILLKNGQVATDPRLGAVPSVDPRRLDYPLRAALPVRQLPLVKRLWGHPLIWLDQGPTGACTGFSAANELNTAPIQYQVDDDYAMKVYHWCQRNDEWPGEAYEGSSVNAEMKFLKAHGFIDEYRWTRSTDEVATAVVNVGPVILGINWYNGMFSPDPKYQLALSGSLAGRHAIQVRGFYPAGINIDLPEGLGTVRFDMPMFRLCNSWGKGWGANGDAFVSVVSLQRLLNENGECAVPIGRHVLDPLPVV